jgi:uncharacterized protein (TIGR02001 family)
MKIATFMLSSLIAAVPVLSQAQAEGFEFSANMSLTNDYKYYGFSQSNEDWAVQGGIDFSHESGFYFGTWASSIDFVSGASDPATIELDVFAGYGGELDNGLAYDIGVIRYGYPGQNEDTGGDYEYYEVQLGFEYSFGGDLEPTLAAAVWVSPDWFGETGTSIYPNGSLSISLPSEFGAYISAGHLDVDDIDLNYTHYQIGVTKDFAGLSFDFAWADASNECDGGTGQFCEGFIFLVSKEF